MLCYKAMSNVKTGWWRLHLVNPPDRRAGPAPLPAQAFLYLRGESLHPAVGGRVVDRDAALGHHRIEIAVADRVAAVPTHRPQYDLNAEMPSLEVVHAPARRPSHYGQFTIPAQVCNRAIYRIEPGSAADFRVLFGIEI